MEIRRGRCQSQDHGGRVHAAWRPEVGGRMALPGMSHARTFPRSDVAPLGQKA